MGGTPSSEADAVKSRRRLEPGAECIVVRSVSSGAQKIAWLRGDSACSPAASRPLAGAGLEVVAARVGSDGVASADSETLVAAKPVPNSGDRSRRGSVTCAYRAE